MIFAAVSAVVVTFNSEKFLEECLSAVRWASEIIIIDLGSTDRTLEIAQKLQSHVLHHTWVPVVEMVRQKGIENCTNEWILVLDPDEIVPPSLAQRLQQIVLENRVDAVSIPWKNFIFGKWIQNSGWQDDRHIRFFRKGALTYPTQVHARETVAGRVLELPAEEGNSIIHMNYDNVSQFVDKLNRYTDLEAEKTTTSDLNEQVIRATRAPFLELRQRLFESQGYKDGLRGLAACELMACYWTVAHLKAIENKGWQEIGERTMLSNVRHAMLLGMWDLFLAMERTAQRRVLRAVYRIARGIISIILRLRVY